MRASAVIIMATFISVSGCKRNVVVKSSFAPEAAAVSDVVTLRGALRGPACVLFSGDVAKSPATPAGVKAEQEGVVTCDPS